MVPTVNRFLALSGLIVIAVLTQHCGSQPADLTTQEKLDAIEDQYAGYKKGFPNVPEIEPDALAEALENDEVVLVDTREPREWDVSHIPGAITQAEFEKRSDGLKDRPIVTYCTIGYRSGQFAKRLIEQGFDASNLHGSILAWVHAGHPVINESGETKRVHVYGPQWDLLPDGYESVW